MSSGFCLHFLSSVIACTDLEGMSCRSFWNSMNIEKGEDFLKAQYILFCVSQLHWSIGEYTFYLHCRALHIHPSRNFSRAVGIVRPSRRYSSSMLHRSGSVLGAFRVSSLPSVLEGAQALLCCSAEAAQLETAAHTTKYVLAAHCGIELPQGVLETQAVNLLYCNMRGRNSLEMTMEIHSRVFLVPRLL